MNSILMLVILTLIVGLFYYSMRYSPLSRFLEVIADDRLEREIMRALDFDIISFNHQKYLILVDSIVENKGHSFELTSKADNNKKITIRLEPGIGVFIDDVKISERKEVRKKISNWLEEL